MTRRWGLAAGGVLLAAGLTWPLSAGADAGTSNGGQTVIRDVEASTYDVTCPHQYDADCHPGYPIDAFHVQPDTQIEPSIAVNPADPLNAVAVFQEGRVDNGGDATNGFTTTFDGGKTWIHGMLPDLTIMTGGGVDSGSVCPGVADVPSCSFDRASDAVVTFGADPAHPGHYLVYANSLVFNDGTNSGDVPGTGTGLHSAMAINVSGDGGKTWSAPIFLAEDNGGGLNDKNWLVVDNGTGQGHHTGRVYVVWDRVAPMVYAYCDPDANNPAGCANPANWSNAPEHNDAWYTYNPGPGIGSIPLVMPDGSLGIMFEGDFGGTPAFHNIPPTDQPDMNTLGSQIMWAEAPAAGSVPFPAPLTFTQVAVGIASNQSTCCDEQRAGTLPAAAVDSSGRVYVAWEDNRSRTSGGINDIFVASSTDGRAWTPPVRVNPDPTTDKIDHWNAMIDVGANGAVHVAYRQRDETPGATNSWSGEGLPPYIDTYYQESSDHGSTWSAPLKLNSVTTDVRYCAFSRNGCFLGDYNQVATASNGWTYVVHNEAYQPSTLDPGNTYSKDSNNPGFVQGVSYTDANGNVQPASHQTTWVAVVGPAPGTDVPEAPWAALLVASGVGVMVLSVRRRRAAAA